MKQWNSTTHPEIKCPVCRKLIDTIVVTIVNPIVIIRSRSRSRSESDDQLSLSRLHERSMKASIVFMTFVIILIMSILYPRN
jgi:hypothetical protein